ncbi:SRPBCC family protein [Pseudarthrobacter albicanus]|uniref:SRPBCC family protein n=1 Tax=Pseudarthrobacter albicanus TaxID=2823873 RepID=UPI001BA4B37C|nr:SRPBCC family protein [Pseudarthrobacter albicanus]
MAHAENEITIDRPITEVYAFLADGLNNPAWRHGVQSIALRSGVPGETGAVYGQTLSGPRGRSIQGDYRITEADPGRTLAFQVIAGPARPEGRYVLSEAEGRTTVRFVLDLKPSGLMRVLDGLITKTMQAEVAQLQELKSVIEEN